MASLQEYPCIHHCMPHTYVSSSIPRPAVRAPHTSHITRSCRVVSSSHHPTTLQLIWSTGSKVLKPLAHTSKNQGICSAASARLGGGGTLSSSRSRHICHDHTAVLQMVNVYSRYNHGQLMRGRQRQRQSAAPSTDQQAVASSRQSTRAAQRGSSETQ